MIQLDGPLREILSLTRDLLTERDPDALLRRIADVAARAVEAERATIFTHDRDRRALVSRVALGVEGGTLAVPEDQGIVGWVFQTGEEISVDDAYDDPRFLRRIDDETGFRTRTVLAVPMRGPSGERVGVLQALNKYGGRGAKFGAQDVELLSVLAAQAAIALENARAWREVSQRAQQAEGAREALRDALSGEFVGVSGAIQQVRALAQQVADSPVTVMITGESGTGKSHIARLIHYKSPRAGKPFVYLNCAALPETLVESELFGIERGVATGVEAKVGRIEQAHGGTLFLDEIADMSPEVQAKVLMVLQEREFTRVGGRKTIKVDVRFISATNRDLQKEVEAGRFRDDLFYRLSVVNLWIPPLRDRKEDLAGLIEHLLGKACQEYNRKIPRIGAAAREVLLSYDWPGNVREVDNEVRRLVSLAPAGGEVEERHLSERVRSRAVREKLGALAGRGTLDEAVTTLEEEMIRSALQAVRGNKVHASRMLGLSRE
ncbi:MAG TPA: sigma-54-dependent Fis family transcriptional regulator, partial [Planctomycetota bacterium]|nr:sigma-54-dependent Fis family transcriptional regulator [Planctomycetota bacterium]